MISLSRYLLDAPRGVVCYTVHPVNADNLADKNAAKKWREEIRKSLKKHLTPMADEMTTFLVPSQIENEELLGLRKDAIEDAPDNVKVTFQAFVATAADKLKLLK